MQLSFANRRLELRELERAARSGGLLVVYGRRRVGKTRLLRQWIEKRAGLYSQAIEGAPAIQLDQMVQDMSGALGTALIPKTWAEFLALLKLHKKRRWVLCIDEFPYLVASDPTLPSVLQRWLDHDQPGNTLLILSGSSTRMMHDLFLNRAAPLYGRAQKLLHVTPMSYGAFCRACHLDKADRASFARFSLVGGVPKYWEFVRADDSVLALADELFFGFAPYMEQEPARILRDEQVAGINPLSVLEAVGRGAEKPSEIAARLGTAQTNISRLLQQLLDASVLERFMPFGESLRTTKKLRYRIQDPALRFWFRVYSPHRTRWRGYSTAEKSRLIDEHAALVFEDYCRQQYPDSGSYWEGDVEFDVVNKIKSSTGAGVLNISEVKWAKQSAASVRRICTQLSANYQRSSLCRKYREAVSFKVLDPRILRLAKSD
jgi:uncharacterized protein